MKHQLIALAAGLAMLTALSLPVQAETDYYAGYEWAGTYAPWAAEAFESGGD